MTLATESKATEAEPAAVDRWLQAGEAVLVDVREPSEHRREHIPGAVLLPLSRFDPAKAPAPDGKRTIVHCKAGKRGADAAARLARSGRPDVSNMAGGLDAWKAAGLATVVDPSAPIDVLRQTQIAIGSFVLSGVLLGVLVSPWFLILSGFMGGGLIFAGSTGWCGMAMMIAKMPWNRGSGAAS